MLAQVGDGPCSWQGERNMRPDERPPVDDAWVRPALSAVAAGKPFEFSVTVRNEDRSLGARLSGELALLRAQQPDFNPDIHFRMRGTAGQSFGAFASAGMKLVLEGQANDFVGKGLSGGELVIRTRGKLARAESAQVIVGNVALYGATGWIALRSRQRRRALRDSQLGRNRRGRGRGRSRLRIHDGRRRARTRSDRHQLRRRHDRRPRVRVGSQRQLREGDRSYHPEFVGVEVLGACEERDQELVRSLLLDSTPSRPAASWPTACITAGL